MMRVRPDAAPLPWPLPAMVTIACGGSASGASASRNARSHPPPIQTPVLNRLSDVRYGQSVYSAEIGDGTGDLEHAVIGPRGQTEPGDRRAQQRLDRFVHGAESAQLTRTHVGVGVHAMEPDKSLTLNVSRAFDALAYSGARFGLLRSRQLAVRNGGHFNMDVDPVEQRP